MVSFRFVRFGPVKFAYLIHIQQSAIIYFIILYTYFTTSARTDGWQVALYEFSTVRAISPVFSLQDC